MAKRTIHECDLSKHEMDPEDSFILIIKKRSKRTKGSEFELSAQSAEMLLEQLNGTRSIPEGWTFEHIGTPPATVGHPDLGATLQEDLTEEELAGEPERWQIARAENREIHHVVSGPETIQPEGDECIHMNRGRVNTALKDGKRYAYRLCKDCGIQVPEIRAETRRRLTHIQPAEDTREGLNVREDRDRT